MATRMETRCELKTKQKFASRPTFSLCVEELIHFMFTENTFCMDFAHCMYWDIKRTHPTQRSHSKKLMYRTHSEKH